MMVVMVAMKLSASHPNNHDEDADTMKVKVIEFPTHSLDWISLSCLVAEVGQSVYHPPQRRSIP